MLKSNNVLQNFLSFDIKLIFSFSSFLSNKFPDCCYEDVHVLAIRNPIIKEFTNICILTIAVQKILEAL